MYITRDALAVATPTWMLGDSAYDILNWHDFCLKRSIVPIAPYNPRNTIDPVNIEYRVESVLKNMAGPSAQAIRLDETYDRRKRVERTNDAVKNCGFER